MEKINVNGRETEIYYLSNREMVDLLKGDTLSEEDKNKVNQYIIDRFEYENCPKVGEDRDDVFARQFSDFMNGRCNDIQKVASLMAHDHRYLQQQMFKVCLEYIKILADNYENRYFDGRNEWACTASKHMLDGIKKANYPY